MQSVQNAFQMRDGDSWYFDLSQYVSIKVEINLFSERCVSVCVCVEVVRKTR